VRKYFPHERLHKTLPGVAARVVAMTSGRRLDALNGNALLVAQALRKVPGAAGVRIQQTPSGTPELCIRLKRAPQTRHGLTPDSWG
jgi:cobalt-zinc-cadmium resistance protein CzcA